MRALPHFNPPLHALDKPDSVAFSEKPERAQYIHHTYKSSGFGSHYVSENQSVEFQATGFTIQK